MSMIIHIKKIPAIQFTYELWRAGSLSELGIRQREGCIILNMHRIRDMAIGYVEGYKLHIRPKPDCIAVMFFYKNNHFWTHLTKTEFYKCFPECIQFIDNKEEIL